MNLGAFLFFLQPILLFFMLLEERRKRPGSRYHHPGFHDLPPKTGKCYISRYVWILSHVTATISSCCWKLCHSQPPQCRSETAVSTLFRLAHADGVQNRTFLAAAVIHAGSYHSRYHVKSCRRLFHSPAL